MCFSKKIHSPLNLCKRGKFGNSHTIAKGMEEAEKS